MFQQSARKYEGAERIRGYREENTKKKKGKGEVTWELRRNVGNNQREFRTGQKHRKLFEVGRTPGERSEEGEVI